MGMVRKEGIGVVVGYAQGIEIAVRRKVKSA